MNIPEKVKEREAKIMEVSRAINNMYDGVPQENLTDFLADLMHVARIQTIISSFAPQMDPLDFDKALKAAQLHYEAEWTGED